ncbi:hypothetical protein NE237_020405 [Protea cynaroides]|uniref:Uncharacterized protein n=1 Tax=Protea cynaroides TaxID=273540 RepID=A0A9Q0H762_9MAGN|nr:hypothetical protein NE237_020405 [Protea cynaroides]
MVEVALTRVYTPYRIFSSASILIPTFVVVTYHGDDLYKQKSILLLKPWKQTQMVATYAPTTSLAKQAQKLLEDLLDKSLVVVRKPFPNLDDDHLLDEGGIQLFRQAPPGIVFDPIDEVPRPRKRPKLRPGETIDEKSEKFRRQLQSVVVDGLDIMAAARDAYQKSLARFEARVAKTKAAFQQEEERVAELKKIRGEKWLPSFTREMQDNSFMNVYTLEGISKGFHEE